MEKQFTTLVVLEEGNKNFSEGPDASCCITAVVVVL